MELGNDLDVGLGLRRFQGHGFFFLYGVLLFNQFLSFKSFFPFLGPLAVEILLFGARLYQLLARYPVVVVKAVLDVPEVGSATPIDAFGLHRGIF